jgi:hypothetical protein
LKDNTVALGEVEQLIDLLLRSVSYQIKPQTDRLKANGHIFSNAKRAAKVDVALSRHFG